VLEASCPFGGNGGESSQCPVDLSIGRAFCRRNSEPNSTGLVVTKTSRALPALWLCWFVKRPAAPRSGAFYCAVLLEMDLIKTLLTPDFHRAVINNRASRFAATMILNWARILILTNYPWKEQATLVRFIKAENADDQIGEILSEGSLLSLAKKVRSMKAIERRGLRMSLPDRHVRPHTFQDETLLALIENIPDPRFYSGSPPS
jgi:hypothetical protein